MRRRAKASPINPKPSSARLPGSGTALASVTCSEVVSSLPPSVFSVPNMAGTKSGVDAEMSAMALLLPPALLLALLDVLGGGRRLARFVGGAHRGPAHGHELGALLGFELAFAEFRALLLQFSLLLELLLGH